MKKLIALLFCILLCVIVIYIISTQDKPFDFLNILKETENSKSPTTAPEESIYSKEPDNPDFPDNFDVSSDFYTPVISSYAYEQLSEKEQTLYIRMKNAMFNHSPVIEGGLEDYNFEQLSKINKFVLLDYPEIFWANEGGTTYTTELGGIKTVTKYEFKYILDESERSSLQNSINAEVNDFLNSVKSGLNEYERTLAVYEYLIRTAEYDTAVMNKIASGIKDRDTERSQMISSVFIDKKTVCSGYSRATQYLLNKLGVFCMYVSGSAKGQGSHAWNLVRIDGDYYLLDTTWGNPVNIDPSREKRTTYNYFCLTSNEFNKSHTPNDTIILPDCTETKYNYFAYNNLLLTGYDTAGIEEILRDAVADGQKGVSIKFSDYYLGEMAMEYLFDDRDIFNILGKIAGVNPELDPTSVLYSFDEDVNVIYIELNYK